MIRLRLSLLCALSLVVMLFACGGRAAETSDLTLWHDFPVQDWQKHAFFQGGGRLGCAVYGGVGREVIQFNEDSLWTGDGNPSGDYESMGAYQNFGRVVVQLEQDRGAPKLSCTSGHVPYAPQREKIENSVDDDVRTKWCVIHQDRPLVWQVALPDDQLVAVNEYSFVSADDVPDRDPKEWTLDGSFGITAGICEMLLQSHAGEVHLLPACPQAWPDGHFSGLRARGGFVVDLAWRGQRVSKAKILSQRGGPLVVVHGEERQSFDTEAGQVVEVQFVD